MKLWVIQRRDTASRWYNYCGWSLKDETESGLHLKAIHAFFRKREAVAYLQDVYGEHAYLFNVTPVETSK